MEFDSDSLYRVARGSTTAEKAPYAQQIDAPEMFGGWQIGEGVYSADRTRKVYGSRGDVYVMDRATGRATALTSTRDWEYGARWLAGDTAVVYRRGDALFRHSLSTGAITQLTDIRSGREPSEKQPDAQQAFLDRQQRELFGYIRDRSERRERSEQASEAARRSTRRSPDVLRRRRQRRSTPDRPDGPLRHLHHDTRRKQRAHRRAVLDYGERIHRNAPDPPQSRPEAGGTDAARPRPDARHDVRRRPERLAAPLRHSGFPIGRRQTTRKCRRLGQRPPRR